MQKKEGESARIDKAKTFKCIQFWKAVTLVCKWNRVLVHNANIQGGFVIVT